GPAPLRQRHPALLCRMVRRKRPPWCAAAFRTRLALQRSTPPAGRIRAGAAPVRVGYADTELPGALRARPAALDRRALGAAACGEPARPGSEPGDGGGPVQRRRDRQRLLRL